MYTAQLTIERIQGLIKSKGFTQKQVFSICDIDENTMKRMKDNKGMSSFYLAKIADVLCCSVDYLLGRTDYPYIVSESYANGDNSVQVVKSEKVSVSASSENEARDVKELVQLIQKLPIVKRAEMIVEISNFLKNNND